MEEKALVCEDFQKAAARTQTTHVFLLDYLLNKFLKKKKKKVDILNKFCVVLSGRSPSRWGQKTIITYQKKDDPSEDMWKEKKDALLVFSIRIKLVVMLFFFFFLGLVVNVALRS